WDAGLGQSPAQRLRFVRIEDSARQVQNLTRYRIYAADAQEGTTYVFAVWKIGTYLENMQVFSSSAYVNRKGLLMTRKPTPEEEDQETVDEKAEFDVGVQAANGEPLRFVLHTKDNKFIEPGTLIPFPITSANKGCSLESRLAVPEGQAILNYADGFPPNYDLVVRSDSSGELKESKHTTDDTGHVAFMDLPFVIGRDAGVLKVTIATKECSVSTDIPWGKGSYSKH
ncbi:MAG: hypothetical protein WBX19_12075, partial [Terracidiphilus sp.]